MSSEMCRLRLLTHVVLLHPQVLPASIVFSLATDASCVGPYTHDRSFFCTALQAWPIGPPIPHVMKP